MLMFFPIQYLIASRSLSKLMIILFSTTDSVFTEEEEEPTTIIIKGFWYYLSKRFRNMVVKFIHFQNMAVVLHGCKRYSFSASFKSGIPSLI